MIMAGELSLQSDMRLTKAVVAAAAAHQQRRQQAQHKTKTTTKTAHVFEAQY